MGSSLPKIVAAVTVAAVVACSRPPADEGPAAAQPESSAKPAAAPVPRELPPIVARINDEAIERWEVEAALREITLSNLHPIPIGERDEAVRTVLNRLIEHHLAAAVARSRGLAVSDAEIDDEIRPMRREYPDDRAFDEALATFGVTRDQLRRQRRLSLEVAKLVKAESTARSVSDADVSAYYRDNQDRFRIPETVTAAHILIRVGPDASAGQKAEANRRAAEVLGLLRGGGDFARLAREYSDDLATAQAGGLLGTFPRGRMDPAFEAAAFSTRPGEISDLVETPYGFHIIRVDEHQPGGMPPLSAVRDDIRTLLTERADRERLDAVIGEARRHAKIEIYI